jgi:hypothetical protein
MNAQMNAQCASLLAEGLRASGAARRAVVMESTLRKAIQRQAIRILPANLHEVTPQGR